MVLKNYLDSWNAAISKWNRGPEVFFSKDIFSIIYSGKNEQALEPEAFLEPYFGNPFRNSCVILNLNPGPVIPELQDRETGSFVVEGNAIEDYQSFAEVFPYLDAFSNNAGGSWWQHRDQWIKRLIEAKTGKVSSRKPFALEICYWHSKSWAKLNLNSKECRKYLEELFIIAEEANKHSELKIIVSVGKLYCKIFEMLGYKKLLEVNNKNYKEFGLDFPENKEARAKDRTFSLYESSTGSLHYNTWHTGGNKQPSGDWAEIESFILAYKS